MKLNLQIAAIVAVIGGFATFMSAGDFVTSFKAPVDINTISAEEIKSGLRVESELNLVLDSFANEQTWTESKTGTQTAKKTAHQYYVIPVGEQEYMAVEASTDDFATYDKIMDETYSYVIGESDSYGESSIPFVGTVTELDEELLGYFKEWFTDTEFLGTTDAAEIDKVTIPYMLEPRSFSNVRMMFGAGILLLVLDALYIVFCVTSTQKKRRQQEVEMAGVSGGPSGSDSGDQE